MTVVANESQLAMNAGVSFGNHDVVHFARPFHNPLPHFFLRCLDVCRAEVEHNLVIVRGQRHTAFDASLFDDLLEIGKVCHRIQLLNFN
jgi:hypothetical protein